ncbi:IucA/IucC family siderophore biosynthesis protein [uncultured Marinococcus sp.]|uniref:IucA/IucC family protein n=1 Tax=uncultured Marinococcus sp. TaxID=487012 RepID=UPI00263509AE|nr:IucA/IucC family protein [uncultured Marinococcus sp.]
MLNFKQQAAEASMQSFINCYLRETGSGVWEEAQYRVELSRQKIELILPVKYRSLTHRHIFHFPVYYKTQESGPLLELDVLTTGALLLKELSLEYGDHGGREEMMQRVLQSLELTELFLEARKEQKGEMVSRYIDSEQALLLGHLLHPTPKSRQGMEREEERDLYSPETGGRFQMHFFRAPSEQVEEASMEKESASAIVKNELQNAPETEELFKKNYCLLDDGYALLPVHPLQAEAMLRQEPIQQKLDQGELAYLGPAGRSFTATSSIRTLYHEQSPYMFKVSIPVKVTNSLRVNQKKELVRGVEVEQLMQSRIGKEAARFFPEFEIVRDPAYIALKGEEETGFETIIRQNPFQETMDDQVSLAAGLVHDAYGEGSMLGNLIRSLAQAENRSTAEVSRDWFRKYLSISLHPMLWLYMTHGIALEAHQQNSVVRFTGGYPQVFYYRDNQGYYFARSKEAHLKEYVPELNASSDTVCADDIADERFRYYFFINHLFGLINGFGASELIEEAELLRILREELEDAEKSFGRSALTESLLEHETIPSKGNLLTRFFDMDELVGSLAEQSVYIHISNPLTAKECLQHESPAI